MGRSRAAPWGASSQGSGGTAAEHTVPDPTAGPASPLQVPPALTACTRSTPRVPRCPQDLPTGSQRRASSALCPPRCRPGWALLLGCLTPLLGASPLQDKEGLGASDFGLREGESPSAPRTRPGGGLSQPLCRGSQSQQDVPTPCWHHRHPRDHSVREPGLPRKGSEGRSEASEAGAALRRAAWCHRAGPAGSGPQTRGRGGADGGLDPAWRPRRPPGLPRGYDGRARAPWRADGLRGRGSEGGLPWVGVRGPAGLGLRGVRPGGSGLRAATASRSERETRSCAVRARGRGGDATTDGAAQVGAGRPGAAAGQ